MTSLCADPQLLPLHTVSSVREWRFCLRRYRYKYLDRVRPAVAATALNVGTAFHDGLEVFKAGGNQEQVLAYVQSQCGGTWWQSEKGQIEYHRVRAMLRGYYVTHTLERDDWELLENEETFKFQLVPTSNFGGKKDARYRYHGTRYPELDAGQLCVWEHKTTSEEIFTSGTDFWQSVEFDPQIAVYTHAARQLTGERVGVLYDVVRKPTGSPRAGRASKRKKETEAEFLARKEADRETLEQFEERLFQTMLLQPEQYFARNAIVLSKRETESVIAELRETVSEMDRYRGTYPRNHQHSTCKGSRCAYLPVCAGVEPLNSPRFQRLPTSHPELETSNDTQGDTHATL